MTEQLASPNIHEIAKMTGLVLMAMAATLGMLELPDDQKSRVAINTQPVVVNTGQRGVEESQLRRERDEVHPHYVSYSSFQRTPGRTKNV